MFGSGSAHKTLLSIAIVAVLICSQSAQCQAPLSTSATEHSPTVALRWSLIPGGGQVYNHQAWKIPIIYGAFAATGYFIYDNYSSMVKFRDEYLLRINEGTQQLSGYESYPNSSIYNLYQSYNRYFQLSIIVAIGIYALNLVDAYVFGHLFDFQLDDSLTLSLMPTVTAGFGAPSALLNATLTF